jgi:hypothetical protein
MAAKQVLAMKSLARKLSALRVTLRKDERVLLDQMVLGAFSEVQGHAMHGAASGAATGAAVGAASSAATGAAVGAASGVLHDAKNKKRGTEVEGHMMDWRPAMHEAASAGAVRDQSAEVSGHAMQGAAVGAATSAATGAAVGAAVGAAITFDSKKKAYVVTESK